MALGLLDSLEDESTPGEARQDATHARHLTNMNKFARDALLAARWRLLFVHLASSIMTGATQPRRLHEWLNTNPPPPEMEREDDLCTLLSVMQKCMIILLKIGVSRSNIAATPPSTLKISGTRLALSRWTPT